MLFPIKSLYLFKLKKLKCRIKFKGGRNSTGRIVVRHRGFLKNIKRFYFLLDNKRYFYNVPFLVLHTFRSFYVTNFINLIYYANNYLSYVPSVHKVNIGDLLLNSTLASLQVGNSMPLRNIPLGSLINNVELYLGYGSTLARAAGSFIQVVSKFSLRGNKVLVKYPSKEEYLLGCNYLGILGICDNVLQHLTKLKKAGDSRKLGIRPHVRGVAMNPIDHPHGGGEGKTSGGRCSVSPFGKLTKGFRTRHKRKFNSLIIKRRFVS